MYKMASAVTRDETSVCEGNSLAGHLIPLIYALNHYISHTDIAILGMDYKPIAELAIKFLIYLYSYPVVEQYRDDWPYTTSCSDNSWL
uniref:COesterase domain-containing protein n=1 Tax=Heterorhabditis bacteriophora TaxID=37862 RepID=A0A1I7W6I3_HETBA